MKVAGFLGKGTKSLRTKLYQLVAANNLEWKREDVYEESILDRWNVDNQKLASSLEYLDSLALVLLKLLQNQET